MGDDPAHSHRAVRRRGLWPRPPRPGLFLVLSAVLGVGMLSPARSAAPPSADRDEAPQVRGVARFGPLPLSFIENRGQVDGAVRYYVRTPGATVFFSADEMVVAVRNRASRKAAHYRVRYLGVRPEARPVGLTKAAARVNYILGSDPTRWRQGIATYSAIGIEELYSGIDLIYRGQDGALEYAFRVRPGGDPAAIALAYRGVASLRIDDGGNLVIATPAGEIVEERPLIYQEIDGRRVEVAGGFRLVSPTTVAFAVSAYQRDAPLIIDPVLAYSTYLGGRAVDYARAIAVDATGAVYVTGRTDSKDLPTAGPLDDSFGGWRDVFVAKLTPTGDGLVYATYLGGRWRDEGYAIAVDAEGAAYVTGYTSSTDFPVTRGASQTTFAGGREAFVAKLTPTGGALVYATFLGGEDDDYGQAIAVDAAGAVYVTGETQSANFPTVNPVDRVFKGGQEAFVTKLHPTGTAPVYSTFLGGRGSDEGWGIAVDAAGAAYVTGRTDSSDFPTEHPLQAAMGGRRDAFVTKLAPAGTALVYSTYLGGGKDELRMDIAVDATGAAHVTGVTNSADFPTASPLQPALAGGVDTFISKLTPAGTALVFSTYLGGTDDDGGLGIAVDETGAAYVTGTTASPDFPTASPIQATHGGGKDAFVAQLTPAGSALVFSTYLGGQSDDEGWGVAVDGAGAAYVTGRTASADFPTAHPLKATKGGTDAFVAKIEGPTPAGASEEGPAHPGKPHLKPLPGPDGH